MLFNSIEFAIFLPIVFVLYWFVTKKSLKFQNLLLVFASYFFYGWWDWRFLSLIFFSSSLDFFVGLKMFATNNARKKKLLLWLSILINLGFLGIFKYYNFFIESFSDAFTLLGKPMLSTSLNIILPVGISFYTFQTLSYTIDIYKKKMTPTKDPIAFFAFVSFFPQLVAGPIERAANLLPQFRRKRTFEYTNAITGLQEILFGLFKKMVIADNLSIYVNHVYSDVHSFKGLPLLWATLFFTFQIYCDFSGYSSIAIGTARLFGFKLMTNFKRPYISSSFSEFWSRWHISLSTWFRDYVYIPLGGNRKSQARTKLNILITFLISGLWHGANWTFIVWGGVHGILNSVKLKKSYFPRPIKIALVFIVTVLTWVLFRAENLADALYIYKNMFQISFDNIIGIPTIEKYQFVKMCVLIILLYFVDLLYEMIQVKKIVISSNMKYFLSILLVIIIYIFGMFEQQDFIYFQF